jgi:hypothetical protein
MHLAIVLLTMFIAPLGCVGYEQWASAAPLWMSIGKWFLFWGAGVRLTIAGVRQVAKPELTATGIFGVTDRAAFPLAQELGFWNLTIGIVAMTTLWRPAWILPLALAAGAFYALAGIKHVASTSRSFEANTAMISDLWMAAILLGFAGFSMARVAQ